MHFIKNLYIHLLMFSLMQLLKFRVSILVSNKNYVYNTANYQYNNKKINMHIQKYALLSDEPGIIQASIYCFSSLNIAPKAVEKIPNIAFL